MVVSIDRSRAPVSFGRALPGGLAAGAFAAVAASLVSLRLTSPDRIFFNCASITIVTLLAGLGTGLAWYIASRHSRPKRRFDLSLAIPFAVVVAVSLLVEALPGHPISHFGLYVIPLAAIVFVVLTLLTPLLSRQEVRPIWTGPAAAAVALVIGFMLTAQNTAGGRLALPAVRGTSASTTTGQPGSGGVIGSKDVAGVAFRVVPDQSKATYTVHEQLASLPLPDDAVGSTTAVAGTIYLDGRPSTVTIDLKTLKSDQSGRDRRILNESPGLAHYPLAQFTVSKLSDLPVQYKPGDTVTRNVAGTLELNGIEKPWTFAVEGRLRDGILSLHGTTDFRWEDFQMSPPASPVLLHVDDKVHVEVLVVAKPQA